MSGVPVITTPNAGSIVRNGVDGFIVPIRSPDALADAIARYQMDRKLLSQHKAATAQSCRGASLDRYKADLACLVNNLM